MVVLTDFFKKLLKKYAKKIELSIESNFIKGSVRVLGMADRTDLQPIKPTKQEKDMLSGQIFDNIKGVTDEMNKKIKNEIRNSILEKETNKETAERIKSLFKEDVSKARLTMIARTESARIMNTSSMKTANRLGFTHKYLQIVEDNRTSEQSKMFYKKYGGEDKAIPIDKEFKITYKGKEYNGQYPPFLPNDRDMVFFTNKN